MMISSMVRMRVFCGAAVESRRVRNALGGGRLVFTLDRETWHGMRGEEDVLLDLMLGLCEGLMQGHSLHSMEA